MPKPVFKLALAASTIPLAFSALAVEFGPLQLKSALGEPLSAELELHAQNGDALAPGCIKVFSPTARQLPQVSGLTLSWQAGASGTVLAVRSGRALVEPAMVFGLEANCGAGRVWQEFPVLLSPQARPAPAISGSEWIVAPGESPRSLAQLLYPGQQAVQRRFIRALAEANPGLGIDESGTQGLVADSSLQMPDWRSLAARNSPAPAAVAGEEKPLSAKRVPRAPAHAAGSVSINAPVPELSLRLARTLQPVPETPEPLRQVLRLEYRLLTSLNEQLSILMATAPGRDVVQAARPAELHLQAAPVLGKETAGPVTAAAEPLPLPSVPPVAPPPAMPVAEEKPQPPPPPVKIRQLPAPSPVLPPASGNESEWWLYLAGAGGVVLLLTLLLVRRRRATAETPTPVFHSPETVLMSQPPPAVSNSGNSSMEAFYAEPAANPQQGLKAVPLPQAPAPTDPNPVMELAEIMLSFGRLEGAAQTLQEYIEANPKEALLPWMKLLDIYRTGDMQAEFDDLAGKLNHHFNVEVQRWNDEAPPPAPADENQLAKALSLEELPHIVGQLVAKWGQPECLDYLHQLLRDNRGGQRSGFALPVVQEILLLIEILVARQAAGNH